LFYFYKWAAPTALIRVIVPPWDFPYKIRALKNIQHSTHNIEGPKMRWKLNVER
jgi:hypothetical protein